MTLKSVKDLIVGALVGIVSMLPGASGATVAVIFGIYERLIADLAEVRKRLLKDLKFIIPLGIGIVFGMFACAVGLDWLVTNWEIPMLFFFAALIFIQIPDIVKLGNDGQQPTRNNAVAFVIGFIVMFVFFFIGQMNGSDVSEDNNSAILMFCAGLILAISKLAPGISGSTVLLALGLFNPFMKAIKNLDMAYLIPIGLGLIIGIFGFAKIVDRCMRDYRKSTYSAILGLTSGSVVTVCLEGILGATSGDIIGIVVAIVAGLVIGYALSKIATVYADETISETPTN